MNNKSRLRFRRLRYIKDFILILLIMSATIYLSTYYFASYDFSASESSTFNSWSESKLKKCHTCLSSSGGSSDFFFTPLSHSVYKCIQYKSIFSISNLNSEAGRDTLEEPKVILH